MKVEQEPKYDAVDGRIVNRATGVPIPDDEPVFIFRAKDSRAVGVLLRYQKHCDDPQHREAIGRRIEDFKRFAHDHFDRMQEPDTASHSGAEKQ